MISKALDIRKQLLPQIFVNSFNIMFFDSDEDIKRYLDGCVESPDSPLVSYGNLMVRVNPSVKSIVSIEFFFENESIRWIKEGYESILGWRK